MHGWTEDGGKVITIAHPEHSSGELKSKRKINLRIYIQTTFTSSDQVKKACEVLYRSLNYSL